MPLLVAHERQRSCRCGRRGAGHLLATPLRTEERSNARLPSLAHVQPLGSVNQKPLDDAGAVNPPDADRAALRIRLDEAARQLNATPSQLNEGHALRAACQQNAIGNCLACREEDRRAFVPPSEPIRGMAKGDVGVASPTPDQSLVSCEGQWSTLLERQKRSRSP